MNRFRVVKTLLMNLPTSLTMAVVSQVMSLVLGHIPALDLGEMALSFVVSCVIAFFVGYFIPSDHWGLAFARKCGAQMGTRKFDALVTLVVNTVFCTLMTASMTWFSMCVRGHAPVKAVPGGFLEMIGPVWVCCYVVSFLAQRPAIRAAKKLCKME